MRKTLTASLMLLSLLAAARADDRDSKALEVLDQAIKAHGGSTALERAGKAVRTAAGTSTTFGKDVTFTDELVVILPDRLRLSIDATSGTQKTRIVQVVNGDKGWVVGGGALSEMGKDRLGEMKEELYLLWIQTLAPLKKESSFGLAALPDEKVNGKPAAVVKVSSKGHADVRLFFDRDTSLLVKTARRGSEGGLAFEQESLFAEHKEFDGVKLPTKILELRNGKRFTELGGITYKLPRTLDETAFSKP